MFRKKDVQENTIDVSHIEELIVESGISNVQLIPHEKKHVWVILETYEKGPELEVYLNDNVLRIVATMPGKRNWFITTSWETTKLTIYLPEDFAQEYQIQSTAGNLELRGITAEHFEVESGAGNISLDWIDANQLIVKTGAGNIKGTGCTGELNISSGAGNIDFEVAGEHDVTVHSGAGNVDVYFENEKVLDAKLQVSAGLGKVRTNFPVDSTKNNKFSHVFGNGESDIKLSTGVGNINLYGNIL